jgi:hypothetical protein
MGHVTAPVIVTEVRPGYGKAVVVYGSMSVPVSLGSQVSSLRACQVPGGLYAVPCARSAMAVRSLASISSCVSKRAKAPGLVAAGRPRPWSAGRAAEDAHLVVLAGHPVVALNRSCCNSL